MVRKHVGPPKDDPTGTDRPSVRAQAVHSTRRCGSDVKAVKRAPRINELARLLKRFSNLSQPSQSASTKMTFPEHYPPGGPLGATDLDCWLLDTSDDGRAEWTYDRSNEGKGRHPRQTDEARVALGLDTVRLRRPIVHHADCSELCTGCANAPGSSR